MQTYNVVHACSVPLIEHEYETADEHENVADWEAYCFIIGK
jgi:hypothetical protein